MCSEQQATSCKLHAVTKCWLQGAQKDAAALISSFFLPTSSLLSYTSSRQAHHALLPHTHTNTQTQTHAHTHTHTHAHTHAHTHTHTHTYRHTLTHAYTLLHTPPRASRHAGVCGRQDQRRHLRVLLHRPEPHRAQAHLHRARGAAPCGPRPWPCPCWCLLLVLAACLAAVQGGPSTGWAQTLPYSISLLVVCGYCCGGPFLSSGVISAATPTLC